MSPVVRAAVSAAVLVCLFPGTTRPISQEAGGTVRGRVTFDGEATPYFGKVSETIVYLMGDDLPADGPRQEGAPAPHIHQFDYTFNPHVLPVMAGDTVRMTNGDEETHNIHTYSKGRRRNRTFNEAQEPGDTLVASFANPDSLRVQCDIHSQMLAHVLILPHPFFALAAEGGTFSLVGVPPGEYRLRAWHEEYGTVEETVSVTAGEEVRVDVSFVSPS